MFLFRLVLIGHTDCATCNFRTTKQILFLFFLLWICVRVRVCATKCEIECVNLTASYLEFKYSFAMNLLFLNRLQVLMSFEK